MRVRVKVFADLRERLGWREREVELSSGLVEELLQEVLRGIGGLEALSDRRGGLRQGYKVMVNGRDIDFLQGLKTPLKEGDLVVLFPPIAGGLRGSPG